MGIRVVGGVGESLAKQRGRPAQLAQAVVDHSQVNPRTHVSRIEDQGPVELLFAFGAVELQQDRAQVEALGGALWSELHGSLQIGQGRPGGSQAAQGGPGVGV